MSGEDCTACLALPCVDSGLTKEQVTEVAYLLACSLQDGMREVILLETLESQLNISTAQAVSLRHLAQRCGLMTYAQARKHVAELDTYVGDASKVVFIAVALRCRVLASMRKGDFSRYREFRTTCDSAASTVATVASTFATTPAPTGTNGASAGHTSHHLMAALRGSVRRLSEPDEQYFSEPEHTEAVGRLCWVASEMCKLGIQQGAGSESLASQIVIILLQTLHDELSEDGYIANKEAMAKIIEREMCPKLGVDRKLCCVLDAWVHLQQYVAHADERNLVRVKTLLKEYSRLDAAERMDDSAHDGGQPATTSRQSSLVLAAMKSHLTATTSNAFAHYSPKQLPHILEIVMFASEVPTAKQDEFLEGVMLRSIDAEVQRTWHAAQAGPEGNSQHQSERDSWHSWASGPPNTPFARFVRSVQTLTHRLSAYTKSLDSNNCISGSAHCHLLRRCHQRVGERFKAWLEETQDPLPQHTQTIQDAALYELAQLQELQASGNDVAVKSWCSAHDLEPTLMEWLQQHSVETKSIVARLCQQELWQKPMSDSQHVAQSVPELERLFDAQTSSMLDLDIPMSGHVVSVMLALINSLVVEYARCARSGCGSPEALVRPPPPLTRFKKSLAEKAAAGMDVSKSSKFKKLVKRVSSQDEEHLARVEAYQKQVAKREHLSVGGLLLRVNSASQLADHLYVLLQRTQSLYSGILGRYQMDTSAHLKGLDTSFDVAIHMLREAMTTVQEYLAHFAIFVDMGDKWYDKLYKYQVRGHTVQEVGVLKDLDALMSEIMMRTHDKAKGDTAAAVARAAFAALRTTLLHGGEHRNFECSDADLLQDDCLALRALFHADGHGVPAVHLNKAMESVQTVLSVMSVETGLLCESMDTMLRERSSDGGTGILKNGLDYETLLCILSHRADRIASKYLKERVRMPKMDGKKRGLFF